MFLKVLKYSAATAVTLLLMWYVLRKHDLKELAQSVYAVNYFWIISSVFFAAFAQFGRALRWKMQLDAAGQVSSYWRVYHAMMVGNLVNIVTPQLGEIARCTVLKKTQNIPVNISLGTVITEHMIDLLILTGVVGLVVFLEFSTFYAFLAALLAKYFTIKLSGTAVIISLVTVVLLFLIAAFFSYKYAGRFQNSTLFKSLKNFLTGFLKGLLSLRYLQHRKTFLLLTLLTWVFYFLKGYLAFFSLTATSHLGPGAGLAVLAFGTLAMWAPLQGGFGIFHLLVQGTLLLYGIPAEPALLYALIIHSIWTLQILLMGGYSSFISFRKFQN